MELVMTERTFECEGCGKTVVSKSHNAKWCSDCKKKRERIRALEKYHDNKDLIVHICPVCKSEFKGGSNRIYCSQECHLEDQRRKGLNTSVKRAQTKITYEINRAVAKIEDPWKTGQLPASVRQNALWG